jgi:two-component system cell cycle sensor histidine kinase/response regulator CckA
MESVQQVPASSGGDAGHLHSGREVILLVEDNESARMAVHSILVECGYTVLVAATPAEAVLLADAFLGMIDLLVTDVVMPAMNGRDLADLLTRRMPGLRSVFMSGFPENTAVATPADSVFLQKPFAAAELSEKLREALDRSAPSRP